MLDGNNHVNEYWMPFYPALKSKQYEEVPIPAYMKLPIRTQGEFKDGCFVQFEIIVTSEGRVDPWTETMLKSVVTPCTTGYGNVDTTFVNGSDTYKYSLTT